MRRRLANRSKPILIIYLSLYNEAEFRNGLAAIKESPRRFPYYLMQRRYRRFSLPTFPHLIVYRETSISIRIMVLKHVKRSPGFGLRRR